MRDRAGTFERQVVVAIKVQLENAAVGFVLRVIGKGNLLLGLSSSCECLSGGVCVGASRKLTAFGSGSMMVRLVT